MHDSSVLYVRGAYRVVDRVDAPPHRRYVVEDGTGTLMREEAGFDAARDWLDRRLLELAPPQPQPRRTR
ncbi:hypothetical protein [Lysobacter xanthus]